ncbi:MAG: cobalt-precorrin-5B (C(1))-methyltransferase CbiD [Candidatus Accumulibacter sp.]|jgi:cobalt-precorrin-5B (C1)-methyltransferase|nr:cobalt-precorrin-5B (C(1))-methyltransferase CbiD [Accumulibacter sp.]
MLEQTLSRNGKRLRYGVTTGSCAAAAAKAAMLALLGQAPRRVRIHTPKGWTVDLDVEYCRPADGGMSCAVRKDAGDDPDVTHGMLVEAHCRLLDEPGVRIDGGRGVGRVTKKGLAVPPGEAAINPVPRRMIAREIAALLPPGRGARVEIRLPRGEELARKTFNPRLGIVGGLSVLGTTGIVEPMSDEAIRESMALEVNVAAEAGHRRLILTPGNHGLAMAARLGLPEEATIKIGNHLGYMLDQCRARGIEEVLMIGHIGKLARLAGGVFDSYSKVADARIEILAANLAWLGAPRAAIRELFDCVTTEAALEVIDRNGHGELYALLCRKAEQRASQRVYGEMRVGVLMFSLDGRTLGSGEMADEMLECWRVDAQRGKPELRDE